MTAQISLRLCAYAQVDQGLRGPQITQGPISCVVHHVLWYLLEAHRQCSSNEYHNKTFSWRINSNSTYLQFFCAMVGRKQF